MDVIAVCSRIMQPLSDQSVSDDITQMALKVVWFVQELEYSLAVSTL